MGNDIQPRISWQVTEMGHTYCDFKLMESVSEIWWYYVHVDRDLLFLAENDRLKDSWNTK